MADNLPAVPPGGSGDDAMLTLIQRAAADPAFDVMKFTALLDAWRDERKVRARRMFNDAISAVQAELRVIPKDRSNDYLKSRYATLDGMLGAILPVTSKHGLVVRFGSEPHPEPGMMTVTCVVSLGDHVETVAMSGPIQVVGQSRETGRAQMTPIQAIGSTTTYLKRYTLGLAFAIVLGDEQDDDGEAQRTPRGPTPPATPPAHTRQTGPSRPTQGATAGNGNGAANDAGKWRVGLDIALKAATSLEALAGLRDGEKFVAWRAKASPAQEAEIARMLATRQAELTPPAEALPEFPAETPPAATMPAVDETNLSPAARKLLADIRAMGPTALNGINADPEMVMRMAALDYDTEGWVIDAAIKARVAELGG